MRFEESQQKVLPKIPQPGFQKLRPQPAMTQKWLWLQQEAVFLAQIEQLSTLGTGSLSRDAGGYQLPCIFGWNWQETPGNTLESQSRNMALGWKGWTRGRDLETHINTTARDCHHSGRGINHSADLSRANAGASSIISCLARGLVFTPGEKRLED